MRNTKPEKDSNDEVSPQQKVIVDLVKVIAHHSKQHGTVVEGNACIKSEGKPPVVAMYASYPNGDFMCWFNDGEFFRMYSLVNENIKHMFTIPSTDVKALQDKLTEIQGQLGR